MKGNGYGVKVTPKSVEVVEFDGSLGQAYNHCDCDCVQTFGLNEPNFYGFVKSAFPHFPVIGLCDEEFLLKQKQPATNPIMSIVYGNIIMGNCLLCRMVAEEVTEEEKESLAQFYVSNGICESIEEARYEANKPNWTDWGGFTKEEATVLAEFLKALYGVSFGIK